MDLNQDVWDRLRADGHSLGDQYIDGEKGGLFVVVDGVAMTVREARAVAEGRVTVKDVADARSRLN